jgi:HEAT repeats
VQSHSSLVAGTGKEEPVESAGTRELGGWLTHFGRTCKTCRLYDSNNPMVVRFREELYVGLRAVLDAFGDVTLEVSSRELSFGGAVIYRATSRDENLAAIFHRDGIRRLSLLKAITAAELDSFLDLILRVSGQAGNDDDLVTLLWEAELPGITLVSAPLEGDVDGSAEEGTDESGMLPWPAAGESIASAEAGAGSGSSETRDEKTRSDDWDVLAQSAGLDQAFDELESSAIHEMARLQQAYDDEQLVSVITRVLETVADVLTTDTTPNDREEVARLLPRVMREAVFTGDWLAARRAFGLIRVCDPTWSASVFFEGLTAGRSASLTRRTVTALDSQNDAGVESFLGLATSFGEDAIEWLMLVLSQSEQQRTRRPLTRALADIARHCPERLLPWMADERWYVVRNVVHILGWIGGDAVAGHLQVAIHHPEARVRREVVAALNGVSPEVARPILIGMLSNAESRLFSTILHQLSLASDPLVAQRLIEMLRDDRFTDRSDDEKRAVYFALASQGDEVLHALEEELGRGGLFARGLDAHWQAVVRCIARIGSPAAREALDRGSRSSRTAVRKACELAVSGAGAHDD